VTRIGYLGTKSAVSSNRSTLRRVFLRSVLRLLVIANVVPTLPILFTILLEGICSSETSAVTRATWRHIPENCILHSHRPESLNAYKTSPDSNRCWGHVNFAFVQCSCTSHTMVCIPSELKCNCGWYRQLVGLLGREITSEQSKLRAWHSGLPCEEKHFTSLHAHPPCSTVNLTAVSAHMCTYVLAIPVFEV
jgi:hypothetical protein